ncbi:MAG: thiamine-phosphate kinase [Deltaproteobacteria bacterium]|nr:thiamine-phosphate kinase [Deltaproteobacteria bacterium]
MENNKTGLKVSDIGEFALIDRIQKIVEKSSHPGLLVHGIGDDAAVFSSPGPGFEILVTCDTMAEGRHYLRQYISSFEIGRRAMVMNISDIGAMGGLPLYALVTLGLTSSEAVEDIEEIYRGFIKELEPFGAVIIGGNISMIEGRPFIDITLIGKVDKDNKVLRTGARPGDAVMVTGYPGKSAAGYWVVSNSIPGWEQYRTLLDAYIRPQHRAREGNALAMSGKITSMIDISDGLSGDLVHICEKSAVGVVIKEEMLPSCKELLKLSRITKIEKEDFILGPSDDYELLFTCAPEDIGTVKSILSGLNRPVTHIGDIVHQEHGMTIITKDSGQKALLKKGWDHFRG